MKPWQSAMKRSIDVVLSAFGLAVSGWLIVVLVAIARWDTGRSGLFRQNRIGRDGAEFRIYKIRTMRASSEQVTTVTTTGDARITRIGRILRRLKLDELPQLYNVLIGDMSFVGPRPDVPGFADQLKGRDRLVLSIRPGITGPATVAFRNEEELLERSADPEKYNREVLFPEKTALNLKYIQEYRLREDFYIIWRTIFSGPGSHRCRDRT